MKEYVVYILYSEKHDKFYKGFSTDFINRFKSHNELATKGYTAKFRPWKVVHVEHYTTKTEAIQREKYLKSGAGRAWIRSTFKT
ncbi:GIY-YIG nuclease family protein [Maribacter chungangensis]|uniref:GIY-YIG nuclease family protein n=1 Tax=Maribacter chungangensis TaxID=1069117 RepID=A0ABW3B5J6_9FLAO